MYSQTLSKLPFHVSNTQCTVQIIMFVLTAGEHLEGGEEGDGGGHARLSHAARALHRDNRSFLARLYLVFYMQSVSTV